MSRTERWRRVQEIFDAAVDLAEADRPLYLAAACGADPELRTEVEALLRSDAEAGGFIEEAVRQGSDIFMRSRDPIEQLGKVGKYEVLGKIGEGGFGVVYKGRDPLLQRYVAIKTCNSGDEKLRRRFFREAQISAALHHPNIVTVHDLGVQDGIPYLVQEFLDGEDLHHLIARRDPALDGLRGNILLQMAAGLEYAHQRDVLHRDIKPANIRVLPDGGLRIMDFGIAKLLHEPSDLTSRGTTLGTVGYLAPEQLRGGELDRRVDIFAFGVLAYELQAFVRPFGGTTFSEISHRLLSETPAPLLQVAPATDPALAAVIARCLEKDPDRRYPDFSAVIEDLEPALYIGAEAGGAGRPGGGALPRSRRRASDPRAGLPRPSGALPALGGEGRGAPEEGRPAGAGNRPAREEIWPAGKEKLAAPGGAARPAAPAAQDGIDRPAPPAAPNSWSPEPRARPAAAAPGGGWSPEARPGERDESQAPFEDAAGSARPPSGAGPLSQLETAPLAASDPAARPRETQPLRRRPLGRILAAAACLLLAVAAWRLWFPPGSPTPRPAPMQPSPIDTATVPNGPHPPPPAGAGPAATAAQASPPPGRSLAPSSPAPAGSSLGNDTSAGSASGTNSPAPGAASSPTAAGSAARNRAPTQSAATAGERRLTAGAGPVLPSSARAQQSSPHGSQAPARGQQQPAPGAPAASTPSAAGERAAPAGIAAGGTARAGDPRATSGSEPPAGRAPTAPSAAAPATGSAGNPASSGSPANPGPAGSNPGNPGPADNQGTAAAAGSAGNPAASGAPAASPTPADGADALKPMARGDMILPGQPGVTPPRLISRPEPDYPERARFRHVAAEIIFAVLVDETGKVVKLTLAKSNDPGLGFVEAARKAAAAARFQPATRDNIPGRMWTELPFRFTLH
jgi:TonB family protein